jgi:integrase
MIKIHKFKYLGKNRTIFTRRGGKWYYRCRTGSRDKWLCLGTTILAQAEKTAREVILAAIGGDRLVAARPNTPNASATLKQLEAAYRASATIAATTIEANISALRNIIRRATGQPSAESTPITALDGDLVDRFKQSILAECAQLDEPKRRSRQRTANSLLRQARSLFTAGLLSAYRRRGLELPALNTFISEPGFRDATKQRDEYRVPSDNLITSTFTALANLKATDRNSFVAIWLALGFGLRKEEIAGVRARNLITLAGQPTLELEEVWVRGACKKATKNGSERPRIACTNGAWEHLLPIIQCLAPDEYLLIGSDTQRCEITFRKVADWMRALGWCTLKAIHEFRAFAGCQVATRDGIYQASKWLRHSSIGITERHYGRYIVQKVTSATLQLPTTHLPFSASAEVITDQNPMQKIS